MSDPLPAGKGLFGYRKSVVNQILADRDIMLRQAEGRVRASEAKIAELESELSGMAERNHRMEEQLERLRAQLDMIVTSGTAAGGGGGGGALGTPSGSFGGYDAGAGAATETDMWGGADTGSSVGGMGAMEETMDASGMGSAGAETFAEEAEPDAGIGSWGLEDMMRTDYESDGGDLEPIEVAQAPAEDALLETAETPEWSSTLDTGAGGGFGAIGEEPSFEVVAEAETDYYGTGGDEGFGGMGSDGGLTPAEDAGFGDLGGGAADAGFGGEDLGTGGLGADAGFGADAGLGFDEGTAGGTAADEFGGGESTDFVASFESGSLDAGADEDAGAMTAAGGAFGDTGFEGGGDDFGGAGFEGGGGLGETAFEGGGGIGETAFEDTGMAGDMDMAGTGDGGFGVGTDSDLEARRQAEDITSRFLNEELGTILSAAEETAKRIVERAQAEMQRTMSEAERLWQEAQGEIGRYSAWREEVQPVISSAQSKIDDVRERIHTVPEQIREALAPLADAISSLNEDLAEMASASSPPLLLAPAGLDAEGPAMADFADAGGAYEGGEATADEGLGETFDVESEDELLDLGVEEGVGSEGTEQEGY